MRNWWNILFYLQWKEEKNSWWRIYFVLKEVCLDKWKFSQSVWIQGWPHGSPGRQIQLLSRYSNASKTRFCTLAHTEIFSTTMYHETFVETFMIPNRFNPILTLILHWPSCPPQKKLILPWKCCIIWSNFFVQCFITKLGKLRTVC